MMLYCETISKLVCRAIKLECDSHHSRNDTASRPYCDVCSDFAIENVEHLLIHCPRQTRSHAQKTYISMFFCPSVSINFVHTLIRSGGPCSTKKVSVRGLQPCLPVASHLSIHYHVTFQLKVTRYAGRDEMNIKRANTQWILVVRLMSGFGILRNLAPSYENTLLHCPFSEPNLANIITTSICILYRASWYTAFRLPLNIYQHVKRYLMRDQIYMFSIGEVLVWPGLVHTTPKYLVTPFTFLAGW